MPVTNILADQHLPEVGSTELRPASVAERFIALLIDVGIIFIPCELIAVWLVRANGWGIDALLMAFGAANGLFVIYQTLFTFAGQQTLGKKLMGIAVARKGTEEGVSFVSAFVRAVGYYISAALFMCGFLMAFFDDKHRALHDFLAGSVVLRVREKSTAESVAVSILGTLLIIGFCAVAFMQIFGKGSPVQRAQIRAAEQHLEKMALLEEVHAMKFGAYTNDLLRLSLLSGDPVQFQRDTQKVLQGKGFRIGVNKDGYKITARARDVRGTVVTFSQKQAQ